MGRASWCNGENNVKNKNLNSNLNSNLLICQTFLLAILFCKLHLFIIHLIYMDNNVFNVINKLYSKAGFLEKYGGSLWTSIIIAITMFLAISYYNVLNNVQPIKADWVNQRCKPNVMPFAGIINPPNPNEMSAFEFTSNNFTDCVQSILQDIIGIFLAPFYYLIKAIDDAIKIMEESLQAIRGLFNAVRNSVINVSSDIMARLLNFLIPLQMILIKIKDTMSKTQGVMTAGIFTLLGIYDTLRAAIGAIVEIVVTILIGIASILMVLFVIPFGLGMPFAIPLLVVFLMILIPGVMVYIIEVMILKKMVNPLPGIPTCFDGETDITLNDGSVVKMKNIETGMILQDNNEVTSTMVMVCNDDIYSVDDILCTGNHKVRYNNGWIRIKNHPTSVLTNIRFDKVYCINTSDKTIKIGNHIFSDYDEMENHEIYELIGRCSKYLPSDREFDLKHLHEFLDGGFREDTQIALSCGENIDIKDVQINDTLRFGEKVVGIVKINATDLKTKTYTLPDGRIISGGPNLHICDPDLGTMHTLTMSGNVSKYSHIYHLITDKSSFHVNGIQFCDYNSCIDKFLDKKQTYNQQ